MQKTVDAPQPLRIAEELILLLLKDDTGFIAPIPAWRLSCALVGAVLLDLWEAGRIDADEESVKVIDATPTGDALLDPTLELIAAETATHASQYWVERLGNASHTISDLVFHRLVEHGILEHDVGGFWSLSSSARRSRHHPAYPTHHPALGGETRTRILSTVFDKTAIPHPHDVTLIALMRACDGFKATLGEDDYLAAQDRIELIAGLFPLGRAVLDAVRTSYSPPVSAGVAMREIPVVGLRQCLAAESFRGSDLPRFFAEQCERLGPVFRVKLPGHDYIVLAGKEANQWVARNGRLHLRTRDYLEDFQQAWGTARSIASMDGAEHYRMRKAARAGNARIVVEDRLDEVFALARESIRAWGVAATLPGEDTCQRLIGQQIARLSTSTDPPVALLDALRTYENRALMVHIMGMLPAWVLRTPAMRRARGEMLDLYAQIHTSHSPAQRQGQRRDLVDDLIELHQSDPGFLPETDLPFAFLAPLIAGHYVGSATTFAVYELLANPQIMARVRSEADALFDGGDPDKSDFDISAIDATHRVVMETLRLHPVIPMHNRTAMNAFQFDGKLIPARSTVLVSYLSTHYMAEHFKAPRAFDIDRYLPPRSEHRNVGAYQPFGIGTHTCLGSRFAELLLMVNLLLIAHHVELEMQPENYELRLNAYPKLKPSKKFKFRVARVRRPLAPPPRGLKLGTPP